MYVPKRKHENERTCQGQEVTGDNITKDDVKNAPTMHPRKRKRNSGRKTGISA